MIRHAPEGVDTDSLEIITLLSLDLFLFTFRSGKASQGGYACENRYSELDCNVEAHRCWQAKISILRAKAAFAPRHKIKQLKIHNRLTTTAKEIQHRDHEE